MKDNNTRYVKTKVDDKPKILHLLSCNLCPLMVFDKGPNVTRCAKYHSISTDMTDNNIYSYSVMGDITIPIKEVRIPDWCGLVEDITKVNSNGDMYVRIGHNKFLTFPNTYNNLVVVSELYVSYDVKLQKLVTGTDKSGLNLASFRYNRKALPVSTGTVTNTNPSVPTLRTCSCCGELVEGVSRKKNFGMCPTCWEKHKDDKNMKEFCFMNNFRLKRSAKWSDEIYKKIKEIE